MESIQARATTRVSRPRLRMVATRYSGGGELEVLAVALMTALLILDKERLLETVAFIKEALSLIVFRIFHSFPTMSSNNKIDFEFEIQIFEVAFIKDVFRLYVYIIMR